MTPDINIKPVWWVRLMAILAHKLWGWGLTRTSWVIADTCIWLQRVLRAKVAILDRSWLINSRR